MSRVDARSPLSAKPAQREALRLRHSKSRSCEEKLRIDDVASKSVNCNSFMVASTLAYLPRVVFRLREME